MQKYNRYLYEGPVIKFDRCIEDHWKGETMALTEAKARSNLEYQFRKSQGKTLDAKISLPGKLTIVN